jgi:hypothetical protein
MDPECPRRQPRRRVGRLATLVGERTMENAWAWVLIGIAAGIVWLAFIALESGGTELMGLATVLSAGAALVSSITRKDK